MLQWLVLSNPVNVAFLFSSILTCSDSFENRYNAPWKTGVTLVQIQNTINEFKVNVEARVFESKWFPLKDYRKQFNKGIDKALEKTLETSRLKGTDDRGYTLSSVQWDEDTGNFVNGGSYRVKLVNKR